MKIKAGTILHPRFSPALEKLIGKEMPMEQCVSLSEAISQIEDHSKTINRARQALLDQYIEKDERGMAKMISANEPAYKDAESRNSFLNKTEEFLGQEFEVNFDKKIELTKNDKMTPQDYLLMKDFVVYKK